MDIHNEIVDFVSDWVGAPRRKIKLNTRLFHDLGIDGDDGVELLGAFCEKFQVDPHAKLMDRHFGTEAAATPWTFIRWFLSPSFRRVKI